MKPLTSLLMLAPSYGASPRSEEFVIRAIRESKETTVIQEPAPVGPLPTPPPKPMATDSAIPSKLIEVVQGAASQLKMMQEGEVPVKLEILSKGD